MLALLGTELDVTEETELDAAEEMGSQEHPAGIATPHLHHSRCTPRPRCP